MIDSFVKSHEGTAAQRLVPVNTGRIESANPKKRVDPLAYSQRFSDKASIYGYMRQQLVSNGPPSTITIPFSTAPLSAP